MNPGRSRYTETQNRSVASLIEAAGHACPRRGWADPESYDLDPAGDRDGAPEREVIPACVDAKSDAFGLSLDGDRNKDGFRTLCTQAAPRLSRNLNVFGWNNTTETQTGSKP